MPASTLSAVRTPVSDIPSSTSVMATAGRIPTTTVSASSTRDMAAMLPSIRPINESTISRLEMSISTPWAPVSLMRLVRSSCRAIARRSCMSTWMVTSRNSPIRRIGIFSTFLLLFVLLFGCRLGFLVLQLDKGDPGLSQRQSKRVRQGRLGGHVEEVNAQVDDRLRDLRANSADDAVRAHQPGRGHRFEEVLRDHGVDRGHARDVDNCNPGIGLHNAVQ